jgi:hypothetical protein
MTTTPATSTVPALQMPQVSTDPRDRAGSRQTPPLSRLSEAAGRERSRIVYGLAKIDHPGRVADAAVERALGWTPETRLSIHESHGVILVCADERGIFSMSTQGHVYLPLPLRRWCKP